MIKRKKYSTDVDDFDNIESDLLLLEQLDEIDKALPVNNVPSQNITIRRCKGRCIQDNAGPPSTGTLHPDVRGELLEMTQEANTLRMKNSELKGCLQMLKFKTENLEKEKEQLQATIIDVKNQSDKQVAEERALREKAEEDLRTLRTTQEIDQQSRMFHERLLANQPLISSIQQSNVSPSNSPLISRKVVVPDRRTSGPHFPRNFTKGTDGLKYLFTHPKASDSAQMTFPVVLSQNYIGEPTAKRFATSRAPLQTRHNNQLDMCSSVDVEVQADIVSPYDALETFSKKKIFNVLWSMCDEIGKDDFWDTQLYDMLKGAESEPQLLIDALGHKT
uniref:ATR-interacting protein n=1 Tax=Syphacia muris TaxID=451379 RepID=A0A0N5A7Q6_9BILA